MFLSLRPMDRAIAVVPLPFRQGSTYIVFFAHRSCRYSGGLLVFHSHKGKRENFMLELLNEIDSFVWGPPLLVLLVGTGIWLTLRLNLLQVLKLPMALKLIFSAKNDGDGDVNSFKALCTALAATVGTGNIVGVATAIKAGGPGALFWMWLAAFFGMATKYAEGLLAVKYRTVDANGNIAGGPMYYIENGLGKSYKPLAVFFAVSGVLCAYFWYRYFLLRSTL